METNIKKIGKYTILPIPNVEFVDPIEYDFNNSLDIEIALFNTYADITPSLKSLSQSKRHKHAVKRHLISWEREYNEIMAIIIPDNFFTFLKCGNKKMQEAILEKEVYSMSKMKSIFYRAWLDYNFTFSCYRFEKKPRSFDDAKFPDLYYLQPDNSFDIVGITNLSEGQLRAALEQRNVVIAKFLDNGNMWHCFLHTYDSILGKEVKGTPHIHYISNAFGNNVTRERILNEIQKFRYKFPSMKHLKYDKKKFDE